MDDNWRDVILGLGEIAGTLGGIWLGWVLQGRRRHDVAKREAYAQFVAVCSELSGVLRADRDAGGLGATAVPRKPATSCVSLLRPSRSSATHASLSQQRRSRKPFLGGPTLRTTLPGRLAGLTSKTGCVNSFRRLDERLGNALANRSLSRLVTRDPPGRRPRPDPRPTAGGRPRPCRRRLRDRG